MATSSGQSIKSPLKEESYPQPFEIREVLQQILESQPFRTSKQCQDLLQYIVVRSMTGDDASLKERIIGAEVFHRQPAYDTNQDPVVRVRAADVRKRLAQYYQSLEPGMSSLHIELQPGSYRAHFYYDQALREERIPPSIAIIPEQPILAESSESEKTYPRFPRQRQAFAAIVLAVLVVAIASRTIQTVWKSPQERFWAPLITGKQPVLIYLGANVGYVFSPGFLDRYRAERGLPNNGSEFFVNLPPGTSVRAEDVVPVKNTFVTTSDVTAVVQLTTLLQDWKRPFVLRSGSDLTFGDLRNRPSVMVGAFNNSWTLELSSDLPYSFQHGVEILNRDHPDRSWSIGMDSNHVTVEDYALITRLLISKTGGPAITAAGIGEYGTQAAAEFLATPDKMRDLLKTAPRGWEGKNMQAVLRVKVVDYQPVAVDVVAVTYW